MEINNGLENKPQKLQISKPAREYWLPSEWLRIQSSLKDTKAEQAVKEDRRYGA
jgi:hypothetical protein